VCNKKSLKWDTRGCDKEGKKKIPQVALVFVRGSFVEGTNDGGNRYLYLGTKERGSMTSFAGADGPDRVEYILDDDMKVGKKQLALLGNNCLQCKKNRYGLPCVPRRSSTLRNSNMIMAISGFVSVSCIIFTILEMNCFALWYHSFELIFAPLGSCSTVSITRFVFSSQLIFRQHARSPA
jgi:hypothetical protein